MSQISQIARQGVLSFDLDHPYLRKQLIAYIGNKRSLQPLLYRVFSRLLDGGGRCGGLRDGSGRGSAANRGVAETRGAEHAPVFLDPFAGSGSVSRLARYLGCRVLVNDWEYYAYVLNYAHLSVGSSEALGLFPSWGGPKAILAELNALPEPPQGERYISRYYAPERTEAADYRRERLFYTRENALIIDAVRSRIEELYPGFVGEGRSAARPGPGGETSIKEKMLLLAALLYQCATHTNTSGVFKACHKGFGGHGRDALGRILSPVRLQMPELIDSPENAEVGCQDAVDFVRSRPADLCYLDPPYNQHQYGSNYHLLNTIALWDKPEMDNDLREDGRLEHKAGIRRDWIKTRSDYCYRRSAGRAFRRLLEAIDARYIVLSYNTEGIIPFDELLELMSSQGRVELFGNEYVKYRGGKQSLSRQVHNLEFVLVLDRSASTASADRRRLGRAVLANRLTVMMKRSFCPDKVRQEFSLRPGSRDSLPIPLEGKAVHLPMPHLYRFAPEATAIVEAIAAGGAAGDLRLPILQQLLEKLGACEAKDRREEIRVLLEILETPHGRQQPRDGEALQKRILWLLRKFAHRKYREAFEQTVAELRVLSRRDTERFASLIRGLEEVEELARARFTG
jgi:adenine-specific DNA-methyltransferase